MKWEAVIENKRLLLKKNQPSSVSREFQKTESKQKINGESSEQGRDLWTRRRISNMNEVIFLKRYHPEKKIKVIDFKLISEILCCISPYRRKTSRRK